MKLRLPVAMAAALTAAALLAPGALAASTSVVISQAAFRGPAGAGDELIQIKNVAATAQSIGGWQLWGANAAGTQSARATIPDGVSLPAGRSYLFTNSAYSGTVPGDLSYSTGITDTGGVQVRNAAGAVIDAVGSSGLSSTASAYREGAGLPFPTSATSNAAFARKATADSDDNAADFIGPQAMAPDSCGAPCAVPDPCPSTGIVRVSNIQTLGANAACNGKTVTVRGIVTGVDDLYGSDYASIYRSDSGIWLQEAQHDPASTTSEAIFVAGIRRDPADPAAVIGSDITVKGTIRTQFGLVEIVPQGVGSGAAAKEVNLTDPNVATVNSTGNPLPAPIDIDPARAAAQDPATRPYYRSLQGMRVRLAEGTATGGGTTKFRDVYLRPGTGPAQRLFRKNSPAAITTPWSDAPDEIGVAPDGGAHSPADPRLPWRSSTELDMDLFDVARNVVGPLTYTYGFYEVMPQLGGPAPTIERGAVNAAYPPAAPTQPPNTLRFASFNVENYFPAGKENDGHVITAQEYADRTDAIVKAVRGLLKEPDVIAVQEVAVFADGADALTGLARALGDYTGYIATNNDARGIAPGFLVKDGVSASDPRLLGKTELYNDHSAGTCDLAGGTLYDRAPFALDIAKGDVQATVISNHFASQSHENACRIAEAEYLRQQAAGMVAAGRNVIVGGDLNDFEFSDSIARLTQGGTLTNLWSKAPEGLAYSYKFQGHLQTLDHVLVSAGLVSRVTDMRYMHFDNDYYERSPVDGTGISDHDPPLATFQLGTGVNGDVTGTVPATLSLTLGGPADLGAFTPGSTHDYDGTLTATVTSSAGDADLSVMDSSSDATGRLVNGTYALAQPLQLQAGGPFAPLHADGAPLLLKSFAAPVSNDASTVSVRQHIDADEGLRTGGYGKTLTFTLSTTTP